MANTLEKGRSEREGEMERKSWEEMVYLSVSYFFLGNLMLRFLAFVQDQMSGGTYVFSCEVSTHNLAAVSLVKSA